MYSSVTAALRPKDGRQREQQHPDPDDPRAAFSISEVLAQTGLGRDKLYKLINEQKLIARKAGRRTIVLASDLDNFLQSLPRAGRDVEPPLAA